MNDGQMTPEQLLESIQRQEGQEKKGRLKIFLGMAAGVGKTYAMLQEANQLKKAGVDIVVGLIDTHGRPETAELVKGLEVLPKKEITYKDHLFYELDIDKILTLKPEIVLIDELAHTNVPGLKHAKRWQDVMEILDNGIDVYTTLNVQHIESLHDVVEKITGISVRETLPDHVIEKAASIQLIDLSPDKLLERLREGKVYLGDQSKIAAEHFFQRDRLTALREIVLRYAAEKVDLDLRDMMPQNRQVIEWKPHERFLVAVSPSPHSQKLIRTTRRLAATHHVSWIAVFVNDGHTLTESENQQLAKNLALARDLGAEVMTISDPSIVEGIQRVARQQSITQIIVGRPPTRPFLDLLNRPGLVDTLIKECKDIDIHVIRQEQFSASYKKRRFRFALPKTFTPYAIALFSVAVLSILNWFLTPYVGYKVNGFIFLLGILTLSLFLSKGPVFFVSLLYVFIWEMFFIPETKSLFDEDHILLLLYVLTAVTTGILVDRSRTHQELLLKSQETTETLYDITRQIANAPATGEIFKSIEERLGKLLNGLFEIVTKEINNGLHFNKPETLLIDEKEKSAAIWAFENGKEAGWSTDTLPSSRNLYIPLKSFDEVVGLMIYRPIVMRPFTLDEKNFLYAVTQQLANYIERTFSTERAQKSEQLMQLERAHSTILERLSNVFTEPLLELRAVLQEFKKEIEELKNPSLTTKVIEIETAFESFMKILANISAIVQLDTKSIPITRKEHNVRALVEKCARDASSVENDHIISFLIPADLPPIPFDAHLVEVLLYNLILNAIEYSPIGSKVTVEAKTAAGFFILSVSDEGSGIPEDQLDMIFEKFYRIPDTAHPGVGLGLAIAKTIAEIHNGELKVENLPERGAKFSLWLPL